uniref:Uncharacterized protein n=1 Tax=Pararge aegeria TaxID=116150 RepID=S4PJG1_9NEOP
MTIPLACVFDVFGFRIASMFLRFVDKVFGLGSFSAKYRVRDVLLTGSFFLANFMFMFISSPDRCASTGGLRFLSVSVFTGT